MCKAARVAKNEVHGAYSQLLLKHILYFGWLIKRSGWLVVEVKRMELTEWELGASIECCQTATDLSNLCGSFSQEIACLKNHMMSSYQIVKGSVNNGVDWVGIRNFH